jgi:hypothetical protein
MKLTVRNLLNFISILVTAFLVVIFLVGDWVQVYGADLWMRVLWVVLLISLQTFLRATWEPPLRWERWIGWGKWMLVLLAGLFLAAAGGFGVVATPFVTGISVEAHVALVAVGFLLAAQGIRMFAWSQSHRGPIIDSEAGRGGKKIPSTERQEQVAWFSAKPAPMPAEEGEFVPVVRIEKRTLNPGERLRVVIHISGYGNSKGGKLTFHFPQGLLRIDRTQDGVEVPVGQVEANISLAVDQRTGEEVPVGRSQVDTLDSVGKTVLLHKGLFMPTKPIAEKMVMQQIAGEMQLPTGPPFAITAQVDSKCPGGDHSIPFVLTYETLGKYKTSVTSAELHVNSWWERWGYYASTLGLALAGVLVAALVLFVH